MGTLQVVASSAPTATADGDTEHISLLVDGELDATRLEGVCHALREGECMKTWACYQMIGDTLRGSPVLAPGFSARFAELLAAEPTVLAPQRRARPVAVAWAAAATVAAVGVVGWVSLQTMPLAPTVISTARQAVAVRAADARIAPVDNEYVLMHEEYSPTTAIQGVSPYLRAVSSDDRGTPR